MFKKILSLALVAMLLMSVCAVSFSAAQVEVTADGADNAIAEQGANGDVVSQGADGDVVSQGAESGAASTGAGVFKFDTAGTNWAGPIQFYVYEVESGTELIAWGSKKLKGTDEGGGIWSYDPSANGMSIESGKQYCIIFKDDTGAQTYDLMMDSNCLGDTAKVTGNSIENPVDSHKTAMEAVWTSSSLGPRMQVTSIGNVVGKTLPSNESAYDTFVNFLKNTLDNARTYSGKDDQKLIDDTAAALGIGKNDVEKAIKEAEVETTWSKDASSLDAESKAGATTKGDGSPSGGGSGDDNKSDDNKSDDGSGNNSNGSNNGSGSGSGSGSSSSGSKSGSASNTQTGQTETVLFIMLGVMVAAAGVIFFARKKERT